MLPYHENSEKYGSFFTLTDMFKMEYFWHSLSVQKQYNVFWFVNTEAEETQ